ncbi:MAG TPA: sulfotransferase domain-containing protein [Bryobacteraceae bacterium]|nr:sulfotransferase domain-containing protein [Bryobacteraceae bacterium]
MATNDPLLCAVPPDRLRIAEFVEPMLLALPFSFTSPEIVSVGNTKLGALIAAVTQDDEIALSAMRAEFSSDAGAFDPFVEGIRALVAGDYPAASSEFARVRSQNWHVPASVLHVIAIAAAGELRRAIAVANQIADDVGALGMAGAPSYPSHSALSREGVRCLQVAEEAFPPATGPLEIASPFRYIIGYPRSGNTLLTQFLSFAFSAPNYSVYPGDGRYFSRRFHDHAPGHAVFVKDHILRPEYLEDEILCPVRDGRDSMVSLARFLYAEGSSPLVRRGELANFLSSVAERMPYGFWGDHVRTMLEAREHGARVRFIRYEEIFGNYQRLWALAQDLADGAPVPCTDENAFIAFMARGRGKLALEPQWSERLAVPEDSFIPRNWSIGGGTIDWRSAFDAPARRRFHDLGGTEMLVRLGYETDEYWWQQD